MFLIDIAVPRNIDPAVNDLDNVFLYDIDDLQEVVNANLRERMKEAERAEAIVTEEVERMMARLKLHEVTPTIVALAGAARTDPDGGTGPHAAQVRPAHGRAGRGLGSADARHREQDRARPHLRAARPRRAGRKAST